MVIKNKTLQDDRLFTQVEQNAIDHALAGRWQEAVKVNLEGSAIYPDNIGCHNRLAKAYLELGKYKQARASIKRALAIDPGSRVARRQSDRLSELDDPGISRRTFGSAAISSALFISDPAVATASELNKVADAKILASVSPGDSLKLVMDEAIGTVETSDGEYVGTLDVRLVVRLQKMIDGGNEYEVLAAKLTDSEVIVIVREIKRSTAQAYVASFPLYLQQKIDDLETDDSGDIEDEDEVEELVVRLLNDGPSGSAMSGEFDEPLEE